MKINYVYKSKVLFAILTLSIFDIKMVDTDLSSDNMDIECCMIFQFCFCCCNNLITILDIINTIFYIKKYLYQVRNIPISWILSTNTWWHQLKLEGTASTSRVGTLHLNRFLVCSKSLPSKALYAIYNPYFGAGGMISMLNQNRQLIIGKSNLYKCSHPTIIVNL